MVVNLATVANENHFLANQLTIFYLLVSDDTAHTHKQDGGAFLHFGGGHYQCTTSAKFATVDRVIDYGTAQVLYERMVATYVHIVLGSGRGEGDAHYAFACCFVGEVMAQLFWQFQALEAIAKGLFVSVDVYADMQKLLNHKVARVFHSADDRLGLFQ